MKYQNYIRFKKIFNIIGGKDSLLLISLNIEYLVHVRNGTINILSCKFSLPEEEELIILSKDRNLNMKFSCKECSRSCKMVFKILLQSSSSYLCEFYFSILNNIKTK